MTTDQEALVVRPTGEQGLVNVEFAMQEWEAYQELTRRLLDKKTDYQKIGKGEFKKKSAWRKYARAFNLSSEVVREEIERDADHYPVFARVVVRTTDPAGRFQEADQECHITERCCDGRVGKSCYKARYDSHTCCTSTCDGKTHFSHPGDLVATATTRAKNRSISDLIGAGEVSAEEMTDPPNGSATPKKAAPREAEPVDAAADPNKARHDLKQMLDAKYPDEQERVQWMEENAPTGVRGTNVMIGDMSDAGVDAALAVLGNAD